MNSAKGTQIMSITMAMSSLNLAAGARPITPLAPATEKLAELVVTQ